MGKRRILVISQYFYPEQFRINDICKEWVKRGNEVTVITGIPNYPQGKFYKGYGLFKKRKEIYAGVHVIRLPLIPRGNGSLMLICNYFSFVISGLLWSMFTRVKADQVFIFEVSPMTQALPGIWYARRKKIPCSIYVQDLWPENVEVVTGIRNKQIIGMIDRMADYIYRNCKYIFATSPSFVSRLEERKSVYRKNTSKVVYWPQYAEDFYKPVVKKKLTDMPQEECFKVIFTGNIGYAQGLDILPKAAAILREREISCKFYIVGNGRYQGEFEKDIDKNDVGNMFCMLGRKKPEDIPAYLANCDAAFLSFANHSLFRMTIPAKLQSYLACGIPVIAAAAGETERIINEAGAGIVSRIGDAEDLAGKIEFLIACSKEEHSRMRGNALDYYRKEFDRIRLLDVMDEYLG